MALRLSIIIGKAEGIWARFCVRAVPPELATALTPYVVLLSTPVAFDYAELKVGRYKGLLYVTTLGGGAGQEGRLLTTWREKSAYEAAKPRFLGDAVLTQSTILWEGFCLDISRAPKSCWRRLIPKLRNIWALVATLFVAAGYAEYVRDAYSWMVGRPLIEPLGPSEPVNVLRGNPFHLEVGARNVRSIGNCRIEFDNLRALPSGGLDLNPLNVKTASAVPPNSPAPLPIDGKARKEGLYKVSVDARAESGLVWRERKLELSAEVRVWPPLAFVDYRIRKISEDKRLCQVGIELRPGRDYPNGIEATALLQRFPGVIFFGINFPGARCKDPEKNWDTPGRETATLECRTPKLDSMHPVHLTLAIKSEKETKTYEQWTTIMDAIQFTYRDANAGGSSDAP